MENLSVEEAERMLPDGEYVGTCRPQPFMNVIVAYPRSEILNIWRRHGVQRAGPNATSDGYGLYTNDGERLFIATKTATPQPAADPGEE